VWGITRLFSLHNIIVDSNLSEGITMTNLTLTDQEVKVLKMSINHCLETCKKGGPESGCTDCETLENLKNKVSKG
jgi:hypothetical protein